MKGKVIGLLVVLSAATAAFPALAANVSPADHYRMIEKEDPAMRPSDATQLPIMDHSGMNTKELEAAAAVERVPTAADHYRMTQQEERIRWPSDSPQTPIMDHSQMNREELKAAADAERDQAYSARLQQKKDQRPEMRKRPRP